MRCGTHCPARCSSRSSTRRSGCTRSTPAGSPATSGWPAGINIVLQTCFFAISDVLPRDEAIARIKDAVAKTYGRARRRRRGSANSPRSTARSTGCTGSRSPTGSTATHGPRPAGAGQRPGVRAHRHRGDDRRARRRAAGQRAARRRHLPQRHRRLRKRNISELVAVWDPDTCIQCGNCSFRLPAQRDPHQVLRARPTRRRARHRSRPRR